ncbi:MAG TPA: helicase-associated domain-containing protein [Thermomicrobiales bacterium]|nr:helicase-associated domain-containing protein [Thermomicrobiales bacterium]
MPYVPDNPLIVQGDRTVLLEAANPRYEEARDLLAAIAELEKSPEHVHTYRITPLSLWNAAAAGLDAERALADLERFSKYDLPGNIVHDIRDYMSRYGRLKLLRQGDRLVLQAEDPLLITEITHARKVAPFIIRQLDARTLDVLPGMRGHLKHALVEFGYPAEDLAGYVEGSPLTLVLRDVARSGREFGLREYQREAVDVFWAGGGSRGGSGVVVLPCGAGKTVVALGALATAQCHALIVCYGTNAVHQWITEILDKTNLDPEQIGEYTGDLKEIRPITVTTYQVLTYHPSRRKRARENGADGEIDAPAPAGSLPIEEEFPHLGLFTSRDWGLIVYDEVHLLPAPVFRVTAEIQARRRLGLTATLVREDGRESDVFSLIGPKRYDLPWKMLESQGWIATADCWEVRVALPTEQRLAYSVAEDNRIKYRIAAENTEKLDVLDRLLAMHRDDNILVIGQYLDQLKAIAERLDAPLITGKMVNREREKLYDAFRRGEVKRLVVSKVANFAIDLPDANVAIQVSGTFGSRQEEAQRLGRILRPKEDGALAHFYSVVTRETVDQDYAARRQLFLTEQGYRYTILDATELIEYAATAAGNH